MTNDKIDMLHDDVKEVKLKIESIDNSLSNVDKALAIYNEQLVVHIRRTNLLEESVGLLRDDLKPVEKHVQNVNFLFKVLGSVGGAIAVVYYIFQIMEYIKG